MEYINTMKRQILLAVFAVVSFSIAYLIGDSSSSDCIRVEKSGGG
ncbi:MAG: Uncharacterised protein [Owenweeksia sp. TMED14]|nr:MAG: Uncharacterised protein [Owenweeksia sp. TMED14]